MRIEQIGDATLYLGDCREIVSTLGHFDSVVTDPPWDAAKGIPGSDDPRGLFASVVPMLSADRYVVQLGCDSDPAFLAPLASLHKFLRVCWLEYACPTYKGRLLHTGDVAYAYGKWPPSRAGARVIPGKCTSTKSDRDFVRGPKIKGKEKSGYKALAHPMPRRLQHVEWLVKWFSRGRVFDPFMGSGTTCIAAIKNGLPFVGVEINAAFFDLACKRVSQAVSDVATREDADRV